MTKQEADFIGSMNMCDEISNEAYKKIMCNCEVEESQLCEDCISRQAVINTIFYKADNNCDVVLSTDLMDRIKQLPSVTPQQKATGSWVEKQVVDNEEVEIEQWQSARCSKCDKYHTTPYSYYFNDYNYCPNCGAKMEVE